MFQVENTGVRCTRYVLPRNYNLHICILFGRWQYFGSNAGLVRMFPGREWDTNFAGFYNDYDPRLRPWYIASTSGPKDVVIVLDCRFVKYAAK